MRLALPMIGIAAYWPVLTPRDFDLSPGSWTRALSLTPIYIVHPVSIGSDPLSADFKWVKSEVRPVEVERPLDYGPFFELGAMTRPSRLLTMQSGEGLRSKQLYSLVHRPKFLAGRESTCQNVHRRPILDFSFPSRPRYADHSSISWVESINGDPGPQPSRALRRRRRSPEGSSPKTPAG